MVVRLGGPVYRYKSYGCHLGGRCTGISLMVVHLGGQVYRNKSYGSTPWRPGVQESEVGG